MEWNEPLHSSHSDGEDDDSDDGLAEGRGAEGKTFGGSGAGAGEKAVLAPTGRVGRASRISLFCDGSAMRILQEL